MKEDLAGCSFEHQLHLVTLIREINRRERFRDEKTQKETARTFKNPKSKKSETGKIEREAAKPKNPNHQIKDKSVSFIVAVSHRRRWVCRFRPCFFHMIDWDMGVWVWDEMVATGGFESLSESVWVRAFERELRERVGRRVRRREVRRRVRHREVRRRESIARERRASFVRETDPFLLFFLYFLFFLFY